MLSLKNEALITQTYEFASAATQSTSHEFTNFSQHIDWLKDNLSPDRHTDVERLFFSISTPIYGYGAGVDSSNNYLNYLQSWVEFFEKLPAKHDSPPSWEIAVWNTEDHINVFGPSNFPNDSDEKKEVLEAFEAIFQRIWHLHNDRKVNVKLYYTDMSHSRLFLIRTKSQNFRGLCVIFSPLTKSSISTGEWSLLGFSFRDPIAYRNIYHFNAQLQRQDHNKPWPENKIEDLKDSAKWIRHHYGITS